VKRYVILYSFLLIILFNHSVIDHVFADQISWTEKKLGKTVLKADKAARQKKWSRAIKYGEEVLLGVQALNKKGDARYINQLKNLNKYYDHAKRLSEVEPRVKEAYILSKKYLGLAHKTTRESRTLLYKILISNKNYPDVIPLVLENISILGESEAEKYRHLHYLKQLYSLYGMTGQVKKEEKTLLEFLEFDKRVFGSSGKDNILIVLNLANNYCKQKKIEEFNELMKTYSLKYKC
jgi:hypothetical protein